MNIGSQTEFLLRKPQRTWFVGFEDLGLVVAASDILAIVLASIGAGVGYHLFAYDGPGPLDEYLAAGALLAAILVPILHVRGSYDPATFLDRGAGPKDFLFLWLGVVMFVIAVSFAFKASELFSRGYVFTLCMAGPAVITMQRAALHRVLKSALDRGALRGRKIILIVQEDTAFGQDRAAYLRHGYAITRIVQMPASASGAEWQRRGDYVVDLVRGSDIDEVHIAVAWNRWTSVKEVLLTLQRVPIPVRLVADPIAREIMRYPQLRSASGYAFELQRSPLTVLERAIKRMLDVVLAATALVALTPLLVATAFAIRFDSPGPVLFRQTRNGFNGRPFRIFKFRTMTVTEDGPVLVQAQRNDARVTRVGRWLRRTSIDELPQIFNVLLGSMSLVGPRPHALAHDDQYTKLIANYAYRHHVKPGITGWAQVHGLRGETAETELMRRRVELDLQYITRWSLLLDLQILARTVVELVRSRSAY